MKIWKMTNPHDEQFALADVCGVWGKIGKPCPECASSAQHRVQPLIVEWESGSDVIGDFIWTLSGTAPIVIRSVCEDLNSRFGGFECGPVVMKWDKKFERPAKPNPRARKRVWLPYEGPPLCELWITKKVHIDPERTTAKLMERCGTCARERWEIQCVEWHKEGALDFLNHRARFVAAFSKVSRGNPPEVRGVTAVAQPDESPNIVHQHFHRTPLVVASDFRMEVLPQALDPVVVRTVRREEVQPDALPEVL